MELHVTISDDYSQGHLEQDAVKGALKVFLITVEYEKIIIILRMTSLVLPYLKSDKSYRNTVAHWQSYIWSSCLVNDHVWSQNILLSVI